MPCCSLDLLELSPQTDGCVWLASLWYEHLGNECLEKLFPVPQAEQL